MTSFLRRYRGWLLLSLIILIIFSIRVRLRDMPLERDEGEYAYAGQLILKGIPPYKEAYNMKLPGTYAVYAVMMAVFGQTPTGIHVGVALVNALTIALVFLIGGRLLDETAGLVAAAAFGLMSTSPSVLGLAGHATHFVAFFAMLGVYCLVRSEREGAEPRINANRRELSVTQPLASLQYSTTPRLLFIVLAGLFFGLAFLMKQHGVFFGIFGGVYLVARIFLDKAERKSERRSRPRSSPEPSTIPVQHLAIYCCGFVVPYLLTCAILVAAGVFGQFWFWTVSYAAQYTSMVSGTLANDWLRNASAALLSSTVLFWLLFLCGAVVMWWDDRLSRAARVLLAALVVFSAATVVPGFYFRKHYFITLLPAVALVGGVVVSRSLRVLRDHKTLELFTALPLIALFAIGCIVQLAGDGPVWFSLSPRDAVQSIYGTTLFAEARQAGDFVRTNYAAAAKMAVIGSEPEIYFYARKRAATGFMYVYPLMEPQAYALKMQEQMTSEINKSEPQCCVFVQDSFSWQTLASSHHHLFDWWRDYSQRGLNLARVFDVKEAITASVEEGGLQVLTQTGANEGNGENAQIQVYTRARRSTAD